MLQSISNLAGISPGGLGNGVGKPVSNDGKDNRTTFADVLQKDQNKKDPTEMQKRGKDRNAENTRSQDGPLKKVARDEKDALRERRAEKEDAERPSEKAETKPEKSESKGKEKGSKAKSKQAAMQKFMDSIESEFGIPPTRIVEAMAKLSEAQLAEPPEQTAPQVISQLGLSPQQTIKAEKLYMKMLSETQGEQEGLLSESELQSLGLQLESKPEFFLGDLKPMDQSAMLGSAGAGLALSQMSKADRATKIQSSIDQMSNQFFLNDSLKRNQEALSSNPSIEQMPLDNSASFTEKMNANLPYETNIMGDLSQMPEGALIQKNQSSQQGQMTTTDDLTAALQALDRAAQNLGQKTLTVDVTEGVQTRPATEGLSATALGSLAIASSDESTQSESRSTEQEFAGSRQGNEFFVDGKAQLGQQKQSVDLTATPFAIDRMSQADRKENIQRIMDQAQMVAQKGGGTMKVALTPEGMGRVELKVNVADGKVSMELKAETLEAKKLLEQSLGELKHNLASQKLHVDNVRVDVGLDSKDQQQNFNHQRFGSDDMGREQARQFLSQFQNSNSEARSGFFEAPGLKGYTPKRRDDLEPIVEPKARVLSENKGRGINLVA